MLWGIGWWVCGSGEGDIMKGRVKGDGKGLGEVIVSDGL